MRRFPRLGMAAVSGRGRPSGPEPRAMSRAPGPAPVAPGQPRPALRPSGTRGRSSREDLGLASAATTLLRSQSPPDLGVTSSPGACGSASPGLRESRWRLRAGRSSAVRASCKRFGVADLGAPRVWLRAEGPAGSPRVLCPRPCPHSSQAPPRQGHGRCHPARSQATQPERLLVTVGLYV